MPSVVPQIMVWARETAGLTQEQAAKKLGLHSSQKSSATDKLTAIELGHKEPTRTQLVKMAEVYRRPLLIFYLSKPPKPGARAVDFRTLPEIPASSDEAVLDALVRDVRSRQSMVRAVLEDEDEDQPLSFVGSHQPQDGRDAILQSLYSVIGQDRTTYRDQPNVAAAFDLIRKGAERSGIFVMLKADLGNYLTAIDTSTFRGFSIADDVAPFVVINDQDAKSAWSFTLLHETVHLLLGQTAFSVSYSDSEIEQFCDDIAGDFLLDTHELSQLSAGDNRDLDSVAEGIRLFASTRKLSRTMVAYRAYRASLIDQSTYNNLAALYRQEWRSERDRTRAQARERDGGPSYYTVTRYKLGGGIIGLVRRMMATDALSTSKAARILGVKARQVRPLLDTSRSL